MEWFLSVLIQAESCSGFNANHFHKIRTNLYQLPPTNLVTCIHIALNPLPYLPICSNNLVLVLIAVYRSKDLYGWHRPSYQVTALVMIMCPSRVAYGRKELTYQVVLLFLGSLHLTFNPVLYIDFVIIL